MIDVKEIYCKTALSKSGIYGIDYSINPYVGCQHNCSYCFARYMSKYRQNFKQWGSFVDVKINIHEVLKKEIEKIKPGTVLISSVTDPYQPIEKKYELTRRVLEMLPKNKFKIFILTKSSLVLRDMDLLNECDVGFTIITTDESIRKIFEPNASPIYERIRALHELKANEISTYVMIGPILPFITEKGLDELISKIANAGVDRILIDRLNIKAGNWQTIKESLNKIDSNLISKYQKILFSENNYFESIKEKIKVICQESGIEYHFCY
ncbi:MAG: radical SAM protein [Candidatus Aenigmatarchaeota archaeon]